MTSTPSTQDTGLALLRVALGTMWIAHALLKWFVFTLPGTAQFFESVGYAGWLAYPVFAAELVGGLAILLGVHARQVSLALVPVMLAAAWVHVPNGWLFTNKGGGWEYPVFLAVASVVLALSGEGRWALRSTPLWRAP
jgi:putative oxidoreductase